MLFQSIIYVSENFENIVQSVQHLLGLDEISMQHIVEIHHAPKKKSIGIKEIETLQEWNSTKIDIPQLGIINNAELLTPQAQNALLKLTEEPNENKILVFATSNPYSLLETIRSRCKIHYDTAYEEDLQQEALAIINSSFLQREDALQKLIGEESADYAQLILERISLILSTDYVNSPDLIEKCFIVARTLKTQVQKKLLADTFNILIEQITLKNS